MNICGVICEFNPFHNGHKYLLDAAREYGDAVICVMSGSFVQRGEAAIFDKWTRARAALENGADIVAELPTAYVLSSAEQFAYGGIATLKAAGASHFIFGSEEGSINTLSDCAKALSNENGEVRSHIRTLLDSGLSYPDALCKAYAGTPYADIMKKPNNILGIEYLRACEKTGFCGTAHTIRRTGADHDAKSGYGSFCSGLKLREMLSNGNDISAYVPYVPKAHVRCTDALSPLLCGLLRTRGTDAFSNIPDVCEGIENRILSCARTHSTVSGIIDAAKTKRYTRARLSRLCMNIMLGTDRECAHTAPAYLRILGMNETGMAALRMIKQNTDIDIITKAADYRGGDKKFELDVKATDLAALCSPSGRRAGADYTTSPIIIN